MAVDFQLAAPPCRDDAVLIVVGASARAFAWSAARAGWSVHAADLFRDADLIGAAAAAVRVGGTDSPPYPAGLIDVVRGFPRAIWCYTGALENHPDTVAALARLRPLAGNGPDTLPRVRDAALLARAVRAAGLEFPETYGHPDGLPADGSFVVKPRAGAGGRGVATWHGGAAPAHACWWQRLVRGAACSAAYAVSGRGSRLLGFSTQLLGEPWCRARGFTWCGSVTEPLATLSDRLLGQVAVLGAVLADDFGLVGLVGVDMVVDPVGRLHVIEINPRPTASMELVERVTGSPIARAHLESCGIDGPRDDDGPTPVPRVWSKAVLFATAPVPTATVARAAASLTASWSAADAAPAIADVPAPGAMLSTGAPLVTVFAAGRSAEDSLATLRERVAALERNLGVSLPAGAAAEPPFPVRTP